ncbi:MAG: DUF4129 domain-containing protein [Ignavibacteriota bacterium]|nr:DUF4129 domain-containing protein [Ignavibacteriota bacterium]MCO6447797.1 DUF4129 domain-containing protein [Ignavibacterium album]MCZ2267776.1 DUF4129 domain-containing protein [Ignavibacteriales bacterium]QKJ99167.1 MAG: DUF4129 domain-containing protein [Ignavibacteriota bacterium]HOJ08921.1 DUF4129 domain-containing protein [Ignavibacteriaceae bacterium]
MKELNQFNNQIFFICLFVLIGNYVLSAQYKGYFPNAVQASGVSSKFNLDTSFVEVRQLDSQIIKSYLKDKDFRYFENPEDTKTLWERFKDWIQEQIDMLYSLDPQGIRQDIIQYLLIAFAVLALMYGFYRNEIKGLFFGNKSIKQIIVNEVIEDIHTIDFNKMIEEAVQNKNYRYAIRLNYLRILKLLSDKQIINWSPEKTNHEYLKEIKSNTLFSSFSVITNDFENIWYGGFIIDQNNYSLLVGRYRDIHSLLERYQ